MFKSLLPVYFFQSEILFSLWLGLAPGWSHAIKYICRSYSQPLIFPVVCFFCNRNLLESYHSGQERSDKRLSTMQKYKNDSADWNFCQKINSPTDFKFHVFQKNLTFWYNQALLKRDTFRRAWSNIELEPNTHLSFYKRWIDHG